MSNHKKLLEYLQSQIGKESYTSFSPYGQWLGGKVIAAEEGHLIIGFSVREDMTNPIGIMHGGVIAGMIDDTIGMVVSSLGFETYSVSVNLNIDYLSGGKVGDDLTVEAKVVRKGNSLVHTECSVHNQKGTLIAKGTANLFRTHHVKKDFFTKM